MLNWTLFSDMVEDKINKIKHIDQSNIKTTVDTLTNIITIAVGIAISSSIN